MPQVGRMENLIAQINAFPECEATRANNREVLIVLTETHNEEADKDLFENLNNLENLRLLTLVSAFSK